MSFPASQVGTWGGQPVFSRHLLNWKLKSNKQETDWTVLTSTEWLSPCSFMFVSVKSCLHFFECLCIFYLYLLFVFVLILDWTNIHTLYLAWREVLKSSCTGLCVNLTQARVSREKGASAEEMPPWDPAVRHCLKLVINKGRAGGAIPGLVVLGSIRK